MTADRATLKAAVLQAIPDGTAIACHGDAERLADTIVDAVTAVTDEGVTVEWGLRHRPSGGIWCTTNEREIRQNLASGGASGHWQLVQRRRTEWEAVIPDA